MRISDWSSDVCSSDLLIDAGAEGRGQDQHAEPPHLGRQLRQPPVQLQPLAMHRPPQIDELRDPREADRYREDDRDDAAVVAVAAQPDRKRVVSGKSVSVRVDLGCRLILKKKKT